MPPPASGRGDAQARKILVVQPSLQPPGGSNGVAVWMVQALKHDYAVSVLTWVPVDLGPINRYYGTSLSPGDFSAFSVPAVVRKLFGLVPWHLAFLKNNLLLGEYRKIQRHFDVVIGVNNEADLGRRGIQYVHFPWGWPRRRHLAWLYRRLCLWLVGFSLERVKANVTLVNSDWTGRKVAELYGIPTRTLYPMVPGAFPEVPWEERENGFLSIGKITPRKELEKVIEVLRRVRSRGWEVHLHIVGSVDELPENIRYYQQIRQKVRENASWAFLEENPSREELARLLTRHRYGLHGMSEEHFGIAVAELARAGCIVFVPRGGGQVEIVGGNEGLLYGSIGEAVEKITGVLGDAERQVALRGFLAHRAALFSTERFTREVQEVVRSFVEREVSEPCLKA